MSDDLVKRLRFGVALDEQGDVSWCNQEAMFKAADRIEKLEAALLVIEGMLSERLPSAEKCEMACEYVRGIEYDRTR